MPNSRASAAGFLGRRQRCLHGHRLERAYPGRPRNPMFRFGRNPRSFSPMMTSPRSGSLGRRSYGRRLSCPPLGPRSPDQFSFADREENIVDRDDVANRCRLDGKCSWIEGRGGRESSPVGFGSLMWSLLPPFQPGFLGGGDGAKRVSKWATERPRSFESGTTSRFAAAWCRCVR